MIQSFKRGQKFNVILREFKVSFTIWNILILNVRLNGDNEEK